MTDILDKIKHLGSPALRGLAGEFAPSIAAGLFSEYLAKVPITTIMDYVEQDRCLWDEVDPTMKVKIQNLVSNLGDISWLNTKWAINAVRKDLPGYASLFLGWPEGMAWLEKQVQEIHDGVGNV